MRKTILAIALAVAAAAFLPAFATDTTQDSSISSVGTGIHMLSNNTQDDYNRLCFGGTTASFPALKRSSALLLVKTADDAGYSDLRLRTLLVDKTITAPGTTGNRGINKGAGSVNIAAGGSSVVVTNSLVIATSMVIATLQTADSTGYVKSVVPASGYFTITTSSNTAEVMVAFFVINP